MYSLVKKRQDDIIALCKKHQVKSLYLIGSAARDNVHKDSDIDFLYSLNEKDIPDNQYANNFFDFKEALQEMLNSKIDLVAEDYLKNPYFIKSIEHDKIKLYEA